MNLIRLCIRRPVGVTVGVLLVVLFGTLALLSMPVQLTPNVDVTVIEVTTRWFGATPEEIEREIVDRQEERLRSVHGLRKMTSECTDNQAKVRLEFYPGTSKDAALRDVQDKLRQVTGYPADVDEPTVQATDPAIDSPIAWLILYSDDPATSARVREMRDFVEDYVKPYLDRVPGVASVNIYGGLEREAQVVVDPGKLAARGLTFGQLITALQRRNVNISGGTRTQGKRDYTVRTVGEYRSLEQIASTVIADTPGGPVYVRDVAEVRLGFKDPTSMVRSKGQYVLALPVRREVGTNVMQVMRQLKQAVRRINEEVLAARGLDLRLEQVYDETVYIRQAIRMVVQNIFYGGTLAVIVLLVFLRNLRATLVVALAIPIAVIGTFIVMAGLGRTLNVISLAGMAFAVGMVVDNAIVVLENIFRHRQMGKSAFAAALEGTREVWGAVLASTLTTMAVFIPVVFVQEEAGQLFRDISLAAAAAVGLSLFVSVTAVPSLAARTLGARGKVGTWERENGSERDTDATSRPSSASVASGVSARRGPREGVGHGGPTLQGNHEHGGTTLQESEAQADSRGRLSAMLLSWLDWLLASVPRRIAVAGVLTIGSLWCARYLVPDATYLPAGNRNLVFGFLLTPPGYSLDEFERMAHTIEAVVAPYWQVQPGSPEKRKLDQRWIQQARQMIERGQIPELTGDQAAHLSWLERDRIRREWLTPPPAIDNFFYVSFNGGCFMGASSRDPARVKPLTRLLQVAGQQIPGVFAIFHQASLFRFSGGNNAEVQVRGDDLDHVTAAASALYQELSQRFGRPRPSPANFNLGRPELQIRPNPERAAAVGLSIRDVGQVVEAAVDGLFVGDYRVSGGDVIDLSLYIAGDHHGAITPEIAQIPLYTPTGQIVPLAAAVELVETTALEQINHTERQRSVTLTVDPPEAMALDAVIREIRDEIVPKLRQQGRIAPDVLVTLSGNADKLAQARAVMVGQWSGWNLDSLRSIVSSRFFLSVLIVYLLLAALYESWVYPTVIMFAVPLAVFGGFLGLSIARWATLLSTDQPVQQLDVLTFLGFVILVGIVVNNAILLVNQSLIHLREHGLPLHEAVREAVRVRTRPVLMTTLTTFFGQLPLALMPGAGSELYRGLAAVMLGGLLIATLGTLVVVPSVFSLVAQLRQRLGRVEPVGATAAPVARDR